VAIFDADFIVPSDFLKRIVPHFQDPKVGMVQARWGYLNRDYSLLTRLQSILLDGHFAIEHTARAFSGRFFNFNGTAGAFRRRAIDMAGGWEGDTLTEDLDLSYRAQMAGWQFVFVPDLVCRSELPVDIYGFKTQQHRWTKGAIQVGKKVLPAVWRSDLPFRVKLEATFHLSSNICYPLIVLLSGLLPFSLVFRHHLMLGGIEFWEVPIFLFTTGSVFVFCLVSQREIYRDWKWRLKEIPFILDDWKGKIYRSIDARSILVEGFFAVYMCLAFVLLFKLGIWGAMPYLLLFAAGYVYVLGLSLLHTRR
jgi:cellulose synthase/poly-beta-1,6-N-acetylglucosamine synthase-like glycosyltransferase